MPSIAGSSNANTTNKEEGEQTPDQQAAQSNDAMNSMMQMGFPMNPEQMQQQMMMMQQQMMGAGNAENNTNNDQGFTDKTEEENQGAAAGSMPDMNAMMAMGGMPGMPDMQTMMNMFGMGMQDMSGFQNMAMAQGEWVPDFPRRVLMELLAAMGNFGNGSPVPGMVSIGDGSNGRGGMGMQQNVPTGPAQHTMRGGFRGRGRGALAVRGRGGSNSE